MASTEKKILFNNWDGHNIFCVYHRPVDRTISKQILYVHPFGDEMNKSRRMVSLQAEQFAQNGIAVLLVDLYGCGDSDGQFRDASWKNWIETIHSAYQWLVQNEDVPVIFWGLRLGCLLINEFLNSHNIPRSDLLFWQPLSTGLQFTRLLRRQYMLSGFNQNSDISDMTLILEANGFVEISGYEINNDLLTGMEGAQLSNFHPGRIRNLVWREISPQEKKGLGSSSSKILKAFSDKGIQIDQDLICGKQFWNTIEIEVNPELIESSIGAVAAFINDND